MNKKKTFQLYFLLGLLLSACNAQKSVEPSIAITWEMGKNNVEPGYYEGAFYIKNTGEKPLNGDWIIYFNQQTPVITKPADDAPLKIEWINSTYHKMLPTAHYQPLAPGETLKFTYRGKGSLIREALGPEGTYIVMRDKKGNELQPQNIPIERLPFTHSYQWTSASNQFPYSGGDYVYKQSALFNNPVKPDATAIFPRPKSIVKSEGASAFSKSVNLKYAPEFENEAALLKEKLAALGCTVLENGETLVELKKINTEQKHPAEYYEINVSSNGFNLAGIDAHGVFNACQTLVNMLENAGDLPAQIANMQIADYPDMEYRGMMLDVARNFTKKENVMKIIDLLSSYKLNVFHFHLSDDEAWRIEIPGLEELTQIGSRRGHTLDESTCLYPMFTWGWNPLDTTTLANGYYTCNDFIDILKYAQKRHIKVIPEIDMPGHSRAAIKSMNVRYNKYIKTDKAKAEEYLLTDFADSSKYLSAQNFTDNVLNVAMPSTYRFLEKVIDEIAKMYSAAGVELPVFHIGGDEVPHGAWEGSAVCHNFMKEKGMTEIRELKDYFLEQVLPMLAKHNMQPAGWEEVAMKPGNIPNERFKDSNVLSYCWNAVAEWKGDEISYKLANAGYPVVLCNVTNNYMDMSYCSHPQEKGLSWGGYVNEYNSFDMLPYDVYKSVRQNLKGEPVDILSASKTKLPLLQTAHGQIKGLQAQLWAETIRNFDQIEYCLFPKLFGLIERAWNAQPDWSLSADNTLYEKAKQEYNAQIAFYELPRLAKKGANFRVAQPGIVVRDGLLYANNTIPGAVIRYTTDGSEPTENSAVWEKPVPCDAKQVKAKAFYLGKKSLTIIWGNE
jgi:hexosaminidase